MPTTYIYTSVTTVPKNTRRWFHKKHRDLVDAGTENGLNAQIQTLVSDKGGTVTTTTEDLNTTHIRVTTRIVFNAEADRDAFMTFVNANAAERDAYETANGITHTVTLTTEES